MLHFDNCKSPSAVQSLDRTYFVVVARCNIGLMAPTHLSICKKTVRTFQKLKLLFMGRVTVYPLPHKKWAAGSGKAFTSISRLVMSITPYFPMLILTRIDHLLLSSQHTAPMK